MYRIGHGYDVHPLAEGRPFALGGVVIPHTKGSVGHSDGDALIHAICDALLGAAGLRDIGIQFPDTAIELKGIDSKILLRRTVEMIQEKGFRVVNVDSTICLQQPKIKAHIPEMRSRIAAILNVGDDEVSIKATTTEKLGFVGREEGYEAHAVVLLAKK